MTKDAQIAPIEEGEVFKLHTGHVLDVLRSFPDESIQCVVTSSPYYGLRSYGTEPVVWGGNPACDHEFGEVIPYAKQDNRTAEQKIAQGADVGSNRNFNAETTTSTSGQFCEICEAWRGELGLEPSVHLFIDHLVMVFASVRRVLRKDGVCFVNIGDTFASYKDSKSDSQTLAKGMPSEAAHVMSSNPSRNGKLLKRSGIRNKSLMNVPGRFAIAMTDRLKFVQRNELIWHKSACMPDPAKDRFTRDFEAVFFFSKNPKYKFTQATEPSKSEGDVFRNMRTTRTVGFEPQKNKHYASFPTKLMEPYILAGTDPGDIVLDPFSGTASSGIAALRNGRRYIGIDLLPAYNEIAEERLRNVQVNLFAK